MWFSIKLSFVLFAIYWTTSLALVSSFREACTHTAECTDHRMQCSEVDFKCICDKFHEWKGVEFGCVQKYDLNTILNMTITSTDNKGALEKDQQSVFIGHKVAGFFVMSVGVLCPFIVTIYCCHVRKKDKALRNDLNEARERLAASNKRKKTMAGPSYAIV